MISENTWKIATCNIRGANLASKREEINNWHLSNKNTISIISETKTKTNQHKWISIENDQVK